MGFGSGHMMDFNNRMNNNRNLRKKDKFKSSVSYLYEKKSIFQGNKVKRAIQGRIGKNPKEI